MSERSRRVKVWETFKRANRKADGMAKGVISVTYVNHRQIVQELVKGISGFEIIQIEERGFSNKFGKTIKEYIIIVRKTSSNSEFSNCSREI